MSLINQVLKDLEKRHAGAGEVRGMSRAVRPLPEDGPRRSVWIVLGLVAAGAVAGGAWWFMASAPPAPSRPNPGGIVSAPAPAKAPEAAPAPAQLAEVAPAPPVNMAPSAPPPAAVPAPAAGLASSTAAQPIPPMAPMPPAGSPPAETPSSKSQAVPAPRGAPAPMPASTTAAATTGTAAADGSAATTPAAVTKPALTPVRKPKPKPASEESAKPAAPEKAAEYPASGAGEAPASIDKQVHPPSQRERAEAEFRQGMAALHAGNPAEAEDKLTAALVIDPLEDSARQALLGMYIERGRREDAERLLEDRLRVDRKHAGFAMALGRLQLERGANGDALITLQRSLPFGENSADYQAMTANALGRVGRHKESTERFEAATRLAPRNPVWLMGLGVELRADNRPVEARAAFQRARELGGLNPQLASFVDQQLRELK